MNEHWTIDVFVSSKLGYHYDKRHKISLWKEANEFPIKQYYPKNTDVNEYKSKYLFIGSTKMLSKQECIFELFSTWLEVGSGGTTTTILNIEPKDSILTSQDREDTRLFTKLFEPNQNRLSKIKYYLE